MKTLSSLAAILLCSPALAEPVKTIPVRLDPSKAYVLVEPKNIDLPKMGSGFIIAMYDPEKQDLAGAPVTTTSRDGDRVTEMTTKSKIVRETIGIQPLLKDQSRKLFLVAVAPGLWTIEGAASFAPPFGSQVTSFSLGSLSLKLDAGTITDLGVAEVGGDWRKGEAPKSTVSVGDVLALSMLGGLGRKKKDPVPAKVAFRSRSADDLALPAELSTLSIKQVEWGSPVEFGNHLGGLVNRIGGRASRWRTPTDTSPVAN